MVMSEKEFISVKKNYYSILVVAVVAFLCTFLGGAFIYVLMDSKYSKNSAIDTSGGIQSGVEYKIQQVENPVVAIAAKTSPSIVGIKVEYVTQSIFGDLEDAGAEGSGIIYSDDGYIITNYHVVSEAIGNTNATITVILPNTTEEINATIVGGDVVSDLAVLKIDRTGLTEAEIGKSSDIKVGELAVAIGNPLGQEFASTLTGGYISAVNRKVTVEGRTLSLLQTDAAINPGNSGGALVNSKGQVVGINTVKVSVTGVEGLGFAIPIDDAIPIIQELITNKKISRPYIGITGFSLDDSTAKKYSLVEGVYVSEIVQNSPATKAGIKKGDIITEIDGKKINTIEELNDIKNTKKVGGKVKLKIYRSKNFSDIEVTLEEDNNEQ